MITRVVASLKSIFGSMHLMARVERVGYCVHTFAGRQQTIPVKLIKCFNAYAFIFFVRKQALYLPGTCMRLRMENTRM